MRGVMGYVCVMFVCVGGVCVVYSRYQVSALNLHLIPLRQGFLLDFKLTWQPASPSTPPLGAGVMSHDADAEDPRVCTASTLNL